ncbi:MAG: hypothetical protein ABSG22_11225 [Sedimentisphaerales bacterium]
MQANDWRYSRIDKIRAFFKRDKFAELAGIELLEVSPGSAKAKMKIGRKKESRRCGLNRNSLSQKHFRNSA